VDFHTQGGDVFLFELSRQVTFDKSGLSDTSITDQDEFEFWNLFRLKNL
jgi:hypothetical protein